MLVFGSAAPASRQALVVEGGAMRGIFAAGVLDELTKAHHFSYAFCLGVSAGATALAAYLSGQVGRTARVITDISCRKEFISLPRFLRGGHWLDLDWLWPVSLAELPFDMETLWQRQIPLFIVTTRVSDGVACYFNAAENPDSVMTIAKASCSVPLAYREFVLLAGEPHTDGGVADSIPVIEAYRRGARQITVVLSRPWGYRKRATRYPWLLKQLLREQPALVNAMLKRHEHYNATLDFITAPPPDCQLCVLAPPTEFTIGRLTRDKGRLQQGYDQGVQAAQPYLQMMKNTSA